MKLNTGIPSKDAAAIAKLLNGILADEFALYAQTRFCHWNVTGPHFGPLHKFFEEQYNELADIIDDVAERVRALGNIAEGNLTDMAGRTRLKQEPKAGDAAKMIGVLLDGQETIIRGLRADIETISDKYNDEGTTDFLTGLMEAHEKMAWMLRAHLE